MYSIIQEYAEKNASNVADHCIKPPTKEASYFRELFVNKFGDNRIDIIPNYWLPKWNKNGLIEGYVDPSARVLDVYLSTV